MTHDAIMLQYYWSHLGVQIASHAAHGESGNADVVRGEVWQADPLLPRIVAHPIHLQRFTFTGDIW